MSVRRRLVVLTLLALPLVSVPLGLAAGKPQETLDGTLRTWHGDTFSTPVGVGAGVDTTVAGLVALEAPGQAVQALAGRKVRAHGERRNGVFAATGGLQPTTDAAAVAITGTKSVAVLLFNFSNDTAQPWTPASVQNVVFDSADSVDAYLQDASYGQLALTGDVHGWYTIDASNAGCAYTTWASQARSKATAAGVNLSAYQYVVYAFPQATSCGWAGLAYLPGTSSWINGAMTLRVVSHEVSHNLGVHHASTLACTTSGARTTFGNSCTQSEYGDPFTVMGSAQTRHHVNWHRAQLGWLPDVQTVTTSGTYLLTPAELSGTPRLVRVARGDGTYLNLEFRRPWGMYFDNFDASDPVVNGVSIRIAPATTSIVQSKLVDANPSTTTFSDAALGVGATVVDPLTGVSLTTLSVGPTGASVSIQMPGGGDTQAPTGPASLSATPTSSSSIQLSWPAATDNVGVAGYRVLRNGQQVVETTALSYLDSGRAPSTTYGYEVRAYDAAGNVGAAATASATTPSSGDTASPSVPSGLVATVQKGRKVVLSWNASTDNVGVVGYDVYRNGTRVAGPSGTSYSDRPGRGTFTYQVRARDAAGNVSGPSAPLTVTT
ncbi:MAG TPA: hypothetical protein VIT46_09670 [Gaiellaceae bacterium]